MAAVEAVTVALAEGAAAVAMAQVRAAAKVVEWVVAPQVHQAAVKGMAAGVVEARVRAEAVGEWVG